MSVKEIVIPYLPRPQFMPLHNRKQRFAATVAHRRAGKTVAEINDKIRAALSCPHKAPRVAYIAPFYKQAKTVAWDYLKYYGLRIPGSTANESELRLDFPNGGQVRLYGADNPDALRGIYLDDVTLDEYADMNPRLWPEVIRPTLIDRKGRASFIGTPKGRNAFYDICKAAQSAPDEWLFLTLKASETGLIPQDEMDAARRSMDENQYAQEFECSFEAAIIGSVYGKWIAAAQMEGRITRVPYDPCAEVFTAWDLGFGDATAIWWLQFVGRELRWLEYYEASGHQLDHYVKIVKSKTYNYATHYLPHDGGHGNIRGESVSRQLFGMGVQNIVLPRESDILPGIDTLRQTLGYSVFDADKCRDGINALEHYAYEFDAEKKIFKNRPTHNWASHGSDAARYAAIAAGQQKAGLVKRDDPFKHRRHNAGWMG